MKNIFVVLVAITALSVAALSKANTFFIEDIRVDGLQRVSARSVFSVLPVNVGDEMDALRTSQSIKMLFRTGKFENVQIGRDGDILVVVVEERPSISTIEIEGNKTIETEALLQGMSQSGLVEGDIFRRDVLEHMKQELKRLYIAQGRYGATIEAETVEEERNRVTLKISIGEGDVASIRQVKVVGNEVFQEAVLLEQFELQKPHFTTFYKNDDKYAREKLVGDLESLRSYYLDRGYINMETQSTQVSVTPDKQKVYVTVNVSEGDQYTVNKVRLAGDLVVPEEELRALIVVREGKIFSHRDVTVTNEFISKYIGNEGYTFSRVNGIPDINEKDKTVDITFFVAPGKRTYVRRINFLGNLKTEDTVLRREMRQMEGAWASRSKIDMSKRRLDRLGFFKGVKVETVRVPGEPDQVDVNYVVEEGSFGEIGASLSYQPSIGVAVNLYQKQNNFFGTGNKVYFNFERSSFRDNYSFTYVNPYYTVDGVTRGIKTYYQKTDHGAANGSSSSSSSSTGKQGFDITFGYPISEIERLNFAVGVELTEISSNLSTGAKIIEVEEFFNEEGNDLGALKLSGSWIRSTLNKAPFATAGSEQRVGMVMTTPEVSDIEYYTFKLSNDYYYPVYKNDWVVHVNADFAFGSGYGDSSKLPYFENFYAGGIGSVRGYNYRSLGNKSSLYLPTAELANNGLPVLDENGQPVFVEYFDENGDPFYPDDEVIEYQVFGGNMKTEGTAELIVPTPFVKDKRGFRTAVFLDAGNVFDTARGFDPDIDELRYSFGAGLTWITPIAPLSFTFAIPIDEKEGDRTRRFEFQLGSVF